MGIEKTKNPVWLKTVKAEEMGSDVPRAGQTCGGPLGTRNDPGHGELLESLGRLHKGS